MFGSMDEKEELISSYNYYIYYNSIRPRDPRLPLPKWKPHNEMDYLKGNQYDNHNKIPELDEPENTIDLEHDDKFEFKDDGSLNSLMTNMNLGFDGKNHLYGKNDNIDFNHGIYGSVNQNHQTHKKKEQPQFNMINQQFNQDTNPNINHINNMNNMNFSNKPTNTNFNMYNQNEINNDIYDLNYKDDFTGNIMYPQQTPGVGYMKPVPGYQMNNMIPQNNLSSYYSIPGYENQNQPQNPYGNKGFSNMPPGNNLYGYNSALPNMYPGINQQNQMNDFYQQYMRQQGLMMNVPPQMNMNNMNNMQNQVYYNKPSVGFPHQNNKKYHSKLNDTTKQKQIQDKGFEITNVDDLLPNLVEFCKDHSGSRLVQKRFEEGTDDERNKIFVKLEEEILSLAKDVFGNYVIQKILDFCDVNQKRMIIKKMKGKVHELTMHMYGCRVIQKAIDIAEEVDVLDYLDELSEYIIKCIEDQNGNHVIQKLIERLPKGGHDLIILSIKGKVFEMSIHQYGCRVVQRVFEFCLPHEKEMILDEIFHRILDLCMNQYGNYVIQHIVEKQTFSKATKIFDDIRGSIFEMSIHKFAR